MANKRKPKYNPRQKRDIFQQLIDSRRTDIFIPARMGDKDKVVKGTKRGYVYCRLPNGQVLQVRNNKVAARPGRNVLLGYEPTRPGLLQVLAPRDSIVDDDMYDLPSHGDSHTWPEYDAAYIRDEQYLPLLAIPSGDWEVQIYRKVLLWPDQSAYVLIADQKVNLVAHKISSGAKWVLLQVDNTGIVTGKDGDLVDSRQLLSKANIPLPDADHIAPHAVKFYAGQKKLQKTKRVNDFEDLRFGAYGGGGSGSGDVVGPASATDGNLAVFDGTTGKLIKDGGAPFDLATTIHASTGQAEGEAEDEFVARKSDGSLAKMLWEDILISINSYFASSFAPYTDGVTNGNAHDHNGGDGAQIAYSTLSGLPTITNPPATTASNDVQVGDGAGAWIKKTLAEFKTILGLGAAAFLNVGTTAGTVAAGDDSRFTDARTPTAHATSHKSGGADSIKLDELAAPTDVTTLNASTTAHGLLPKATAPAAGLINVLGIVNGETAWSAKTLDGWVPAGVTWTRTGNHTFTVTGDVTSTYVRGTKVRYKDGGSYEYGIVRSSAYSSPNTTITLIANNDYAMAAATITDNYISYGTPSDFPQSFTYTPTYSGSSGGTPTVTTNSAKYVPLSVGAIGLFVDCTITNVLTATGTLKISYPWTGSIGSGSGRENATTGNMLQTQVQSGTVALFTYNNGVVLTNNYRPIIGCVIDFTG